MSSKYVLAALACLIGLSSCVEVPLGDPEKSKVPKECVGLWLMDESRQRVLFDVQAFDSRACIVDWMVYDKTAGAPAERLLVKAWVTDVKGTQFLTVKALRVDAANNPSKPSDVLTMGKLQWKKDQLTVHLFRGKVFEKIRTQAQLRQLLEKRHKDPAIYSGPVNLERVKTSDKRAKEILKAFHRN